MPTNTEPVLKVTTFGRFMLEYDGKVFNDSTGRTKQVWSLLQYLIINRSRTITQDELISILWESGSSDNPTNALKNLVYRLRSILTSSELPKMDYILHKNGCYCFNPAIKCEVDTELMDRYARIASDDGIPLDQKIIFYTKAVDLYKGRFLPKSTYEQWVIPLHTYYHQLYLDCVQSLCPLLTASGNHETAILTCRKAIALDEYDESLFGLLIRSLIKSGDHKEALHQYEVITNKLYRDLGTNPGEQIRSLYREIISTTRNIEMDFITIKEDLQESGKVNGSFICEYEIFKNLYRVLARGAQRSGRTVYIVLFTLTDLEGNMLPTKVLNRSMDIMETVILQSLRKEDVSCRFSNCQYVVMLQSINKTNCEMVVDRLESHFNTFFHRKQVQLHKKMLQMDPA